MTFFRSSVQYLVYCFVISDTLFCIVIFVLCKYILYVLGNKYLRSVFEFTSAKTKTFCINISQKISIPRNNFLIEAEYYISVISIDALKLIKAGMRCYINTFNAHEFTINFKKFINKTKYTKNILLPFWRYQPLNRHQTIYKQQCTKQHI